MLAALLLNNAGDKLRHEDLQHHPKYTGLKSGKWERPSSSVLSLPLFGGLPIELIEPEETLGVEAPEPSGVISIPAFLDFQEWKTLEVAREKDSLILLEDEELIELLLMIGEI